MIGVLKKISFQYSRDCSFTPPEFRTPTKEKKGKGNQTSSNFSSLLSSSLIPGWFSAELNTFRDTGLNCAFVQVKYVWKARYSKT